MIELTCKGYEATFELQHIINLFTAYINEPLNLEAIYEDQKAKAYLKKEQVILYKSSYQPVLTGEVHHDKRETKESLKKAVYEVLVAYTGKKMPWGILTGIRPTKLVHEVLRAGWNDTEIDHYLEETYKVSPRKRLLMREVAKHEVKVLAKNTPREVSIYIGIPFCPTRCIYCSFTAYSLEQMHHQVDPYLEALFKEISFVAQAKKGHPIRSLYIGGGTPTSLNEQQLEKLLKHVAHSFDIESIEEYTVEAGRPDTITADKLRIMKEYGVGRISINPQSMNQKTLDMIGRQHSVEQIKEVFHMARNMGHHNINMDMILGLPDEGIEEVKHTLKELSLLKPENITVHTMAIKRASRLREVLDAQDSSIHLVEGEKIEQMLKECEEAMKDMGLKPYYMYRQKNMLGNFENVGYAKPGAECIYNIEIMEEKQSIIALGAGGITKMVYQGGEKVDRIPNVKSLKDYIERIDEMIQRKREGFIKYQ